MSTPPGPSPDAPPPTPSAGPPPLPPEMLGATGPMPPRPARRRSPLRIVGIVAGSVVALACLCVGALAAYSLSPAGRANTDRTNATRAAGQTLQTQAAIGRVSAPAATQTAGVTASTTPIAASTTVAAVVVPTATVAVVAPTPTLPPPTTTPLPPTATPVPPTPTLTPVPPTPTPRPPTPTVTPRPPTQPPPPSAPTSAPAPPAAPAFRTGGLGQTQAEWEVAHGKPFRDNPSLKSYQNDQYLVIYLEGRILNLTRQWGDRNPQSREAAREEARSLMPRDAQFVSNTTARGSGNPVEIYRSESLAPLFPPGNFVGGAPGDFVIIYQINAAGRVTSAILGIGNNP